MRDVSVREIGYNILLCWKQVLAIAIVCLTVFVSFQLFNMKYSTDEMKQEEIVDEKVLSAEEIKQVEECYEAFQNAQAAAEYRDEKIIMQIDPFHVNTVVNQYVITCEDYKDVQTIKNSYAYFISSGVVGERIGKTDIDISGLVTAISEQEEMPAIITEGSAETTLLVEVIHRSEEEAIELADAVDAGIMEYCEELNVNLGKHTIKSIMKDSVVESHNTLINWQSQMRSAASNEMNNYESKKNALTTTQLHYLEKNYLGQESTQNDEILELDTDSEDETFSVIILLFDIIVAFLIACICCVISYMFSGKINNIYALQKTYGLRVFGVIPSFLEEKDSIRKRVYSKLYNFSAKQKMATILESYVKNIQYYAKINQLDTIYFDVRQEDCTENVKSIIKRLHENGLKCILAADEQNEYNKLEKIREIRNVIFVNKSGKITYKELETKLKICEENDIAILGVLFEV